MAVAPRASTSEDCEYLAVREAMLFAKRGDNVPLNRGTRHPCFAGKVAREALEKHLDEVHEHRQVGHHAMARIEEQKRAWQGRI
jgi:hypothetical protein